MVEISSEEQYLLDIDLGKGKQGEEFCLWFLKNYSWNGLKTIDSSSGFAADYLTNDPENYIPDMCHSCAYDYDGCWLDIYWSF